MTFSFFFLFALVLFLMSNELQIFYSLSPLKNEEISLYCYFTFIMFNVYDNFFYSFFFSPDFSICAAGFCLGCVNVSGKEEKRTIKLSQESLEKLHFFFSFFEFYYFNMILA